MSKREMEWQPIETRPTSGMIIVGWLCDDKNVTAEINAESLPREHGWTHWLSTPSPDRFPPIPRRGMENDARCTAGAEGL